MKKGADSTGKVMFIKYKTKVARRLQNEFRLKCN